MNAMYRLRHLASISLLIVACVIFPLPLAHADSVVGSLRASGPPPSETPYKENAGIEILEKIGIKQPCDIQSAVISDGLKITWRDDPELITRLYKALRGMGSIAPEMIPVVAINRLTLRLRDGSAVWFAYRELEPPETPFRQLGPVQLHPAASVYITKTFYSRELGQILYDMKGRSSAIYRDARIGDLSVASLTAVSPGGLQPVLDPSSPEGRPVSDKVNAIADSFDLRTNSTHAISNVYLHDTGNKTGIVYAKLKSPIRLELRVPDPHKDRDPMFPDPVGYGIKFRIISCDTVAVTDFGKPDMVRLLLRDSADDTYYISDAPLRRRQLQRFFIEQFTLPSPPTSDTSYYTPPEQLYKELMALVDKATKK